MGTSPPSILPSNQPVHSSSSSLGPPSSQPPVSGQHDATTTSSGGLDTNNSSNIPSSPPNSLLMSTPAVRPPIRGLQPPSSAVGAGPPIRGLQPPTPAGNQPIRGPGPPNGGPSEFGGFIRPPVMRPPFFIREIYKNGFLKRLPYNEKRSSAIAKLMKSDRFWVVFSIHDDVHPFLELWNEPAEVASKPPVYIFPLVACQHISPSLIPADSEWSFVVNFDTIAIRFSCNSREVMEDWVEVIRNKLGELGILNPKGNLYSKVPLGPPVTKPVIRDPTSPLPQPPDPATRPQDLSSSDPNLTDTGPKDTDEDTVIDKDNTSFTTSIYLNQGKNEEEETSSAALIVSRKSSINYKGKSKVKPRASVSLSQGLADITISGTTTAEKLAAAGTVVSAPIITPTAATTNASAGSTSVSTAGTSSVYLNQSSPTRHVTVIPINNNKDEEGREEGDCKVEFVEYENHTYGAIFDFEEKPADSTVTVAKTAVRRLENSPGRAVDAETSPTRRYQPAENSPRRKYSEESSSPRRKVTEETSPRRKISQDVSPPRRGDTSPLRRHSRGESSSRRGRKSREEPPPLPHRPVLRRLSDRKHEATEGKVNIHKKIRRKSRRSSSLGPLLDSNQFGGSEIGASTHSLESVESNPRQAVPVSERALGAIPRRAMLPNVTAAGGRYDDPTHPLVNSANRAVTDLPPGVRPPPYHPLAASLAMSPPQGGYPSGPLGGYPQQPGGPPGGFPPQAGPGGAGYPPQPPGPQGGFQQGPQNGFPPPTGPQPGFPPQNGPQGVFPPQQGPPPPGTPGSSFPPMVPLPGLTVQLSIPPGMSMPAPVPPDERGRSVREQQVVRLRQELAHPAGVRLILRKKDVQTSLALVDMFGCVWVAGLKQRDYPVLFNAFHLGDQILSVSGVIVRNSSEFTKLVKLKSNDLHTEIIIRRFPFSQIYLLKTEIEGQSLGIVLNNNSTEVKDIVPGSIAAAAGVSAKVRSIDGQTAVPLVITELNGRPLSLFAKEGECWERLQNCGREVSIILQPADIINRLRKLLKSVRSYKDFIIY